MALVSIPGGLQWPGEPVSHVISTATAFSDFALGSLNAYVMEVLRVPRAMTVTHVGCRIGASASFVGTAKVRIETVDTAGAPTNTLVAAGAEGTIAAPNTTGWVWTALDTSPALAAGDMVAIGPRATAWTSGSFSPSYFFNSNFWQSERGFPYSIITGAAKQNGTGVIAVQTTGGVRQVVYGTYPAVAIENIDWSNASNPDRRGLRFKIPFSARLVGWGVMGLWYTDWQWELYDTNGTTIIETDTYDGDHRSVTSAYLRDFFPITPVVLTIDSFYRLVIKPNSATSHQRFKLIEVASAADLDCFPGGQNFHYTTVNGAPASEASWAQTLTKMPIGFYLTFDQFDDGAGAGGGLLTHPGMAGGARG